MCSASDEVAKTPQFLIYGLFDPRTSEIRYVGKSESGLTRPKQHLGKLKGKTKNINWIKSLREDGLTPVIQVLDWTDSPERLSAMEMHYISVFKAQGAKLNNHTDGGEGLHGHKHSLETRRKISRSRHGADSDLETKVCELYKSGHSTKEIYDLIGVPRNSAWKILRRNGVELRHRTDSRRAIQGKDEEVVMSLYAQGRRVADIQAELGFSRGAIVMFLRRAGLKG